MQIEQVILNIQQDKDLAKNLGILKEQFTGTFFHSVSGYASQLYNPSDIYNSFDELLYRTVKGFNPKSGNFSNYFYSIAKNECIALLRKQSCTEELEDHYFYEPSKCSHKDLDGIEEVLTEKQKNVLKLCLDGYTLAEIGKTMNITGERVRQIMLGIKKRVFKIKKELF